MAPQIGVIVSAFPFGTLPIQNGGSMVLHPADADLVLAAQSGDMGAFEALYRRYFNRVYDFAVRSMRDRHRAADVVQDAFLKAHERIGQLRNPEAFRAWLYAIVRREVIAESRRSKRSVPTATVDGEDSGPNPLLTAVDEDALTDPTASAELADSAALVWEAAASLDADTYTVLDLHVRQGLSSAEIAEVLGISKGNAYTRLNRMKERAAGAIEAYLLIRKGSRDCDDLAAIVAGSSYPPVGEDLRRQVQRHVGNCDVCDARRKALVAPMQLFAALAAVPAPAGLADQIWQTISSVPPTAVVSRRSRVPVSVAASVIVVLGLLAGMGLAISTSSGGDVAAPSDVLTSTTAAASGNSGATSSVAPTTIPTPPPDVPPTTTAGSEPAPTTTLAPATTTPTTPTTTTTTSSSTVPDTDPPTMGAPATSAAAIWELDEDFLSCGSLPRQATITVEVTDEGSGVSSVTASWTIGGSPTSVAMSGAGSTYSTTFGPFPYQTVPDTTPGVPNPVTIVIDAVDGAGNADKAPLTIDVYSLFDCFG